MKKNIYGVSSKCSFGEWKHVVHCFSDRTIADKWLNREEYDFRERELMTKTAAAKLAGKKATENSKQRIDEF